MKTINIALIALFTLIGVAGMAQKSEDRMNHRLAKADSILIAELELTATEQANFLPLYHEYVKAKKENRKKYLTSERKGKKKMDELTDAELNEIITNRFAFKQGDLDIQKSYHERFKKTLPMKKLAKFYHIEKGMFSRKGHHKGKGRH